MGKNVHKSKGMKYEELSPEQLINKLSTAGRYPHPDLINAIWEQRSETEPLLLALLQKRMAISGQAMTIPVGNVLLTQGHL